MSKKTIKIELDLTEEELNSFGPPGQLIPAVQGCSPRASVAEKIRREHARYKREQLLSDFYNWNVTRNHAGAYGWGVVDMHGKWVVRDTTLERATAIAAVPELLKLWLVTDAKDDSNEDTPARIKVNNKLGAIFDKKRLGISND